MDPDTKHIKYYVAKTTVRYINELEKEKVFVEAGAPTKKHVLELFRELTGD